MVKAEAAQGIRMRRKQKSVHLMLTGRDSLTRLVGKRRRAISNDTKALFCNQAENCPLILSNEEDKDGKTSFLRSNERPSKEEGRKRYEQQQQQCYNVDWVTCPVCGSIVHGTDFNVNSHLDACLTRGKSRKLTQRTLLQFSFFPKPMGNSCGSEENGLEDDVRQRGSDDHVESSSICIVPTSCCVESKGRNKCISDAVYSSKTSLETCAEVFEENVNGKYSMNFEEVDVPPSSYLDKRMSRLGFWSSKIDMASATLETHIVGHRFHNEVGQIKQGTNICLLREPENIKDPNAIKVLCTDSKSGQMLGFLPRELAKYLSPLIAMFCLEFKGSVTLPPKHPHDAIPIRLVCQELKPYCEREANDCQAFESLWGNVVRVAEYEKRFPASMTGYQRNFHVLMQEVLTHHNHLFADCEKSFLESFDSLSDDSQRLFIRIYTRKGPWFRVSNISYPEISDCWQAVDELGVAGYICSLESTMEPFSGSLREVLDILTISELHEISTLVLSKNKKGIRCARREELVGWLFASYDGGSCPSLPNLVLERAGTCLRISSTAEFLVCRIQRLFFLNGEQNLSSFLFDLGLVKYPAYNCSISQHMFASRSDLLAYEEAIEVAQTMDQALDENNWEMVIRCIELSNGRLSSSLDNASDSSSPESVGSFLPHFTASWVYSKVVTLGISFLEHEHRYEDAIGLLKGLLDKFTCDVRRGYWTLRLSIDLEHMGYINESLSFAEEGVQDPWVRAGSKIALQKRVLRLGKPPRRWKKPNFVESINRKIKEVHVTGRPLNCEIGLKNRFYGNDEGQCGVEQLALQYYAGEGGGWQGVHAESGIWLTIFGLLMWDIIFADIPNVFQSRFQTAPLDMYTDKFYMTRKSLIEAQLKRIETGMAEKIIIASWESHVGTACRGVSWDRHSMHDLRAAVSCVGGPCLVSLCRHLAQDYQSWSSGMPDLLLWRFSGEHGGEAKLVEVKGPRDRLSEQQQAWLLLLMDYGFDTEVCRVSPLISDQ